MKMMKTTITILIAGCMSIAGIKAQSVQDGINHLYADRDKSAKDVFEKLVATNPNNLEAIYWLGQSQIALQNNAAAKDLYSKTLQANGNAPLIMVGMGHVELLGGDKDKARQLFETAISLSTGKKGADPVIMNAIGRANVEAKEGDAPYAIEKIKLVTEKGPVTYADLYLTLGDAYRKVHEGGQSVVSYDKAMQTNPALARAAYRKGMIYYTQKNWELFEELMNKSITMDPKFAPAYYQLYYYYLLNKQDFNKAQEYANNFISSSEADPQNDYLVAQTCYAKKDYDCAINTAMGIISKVGGQQVKPRVYKVIAYSKIAKGDTMGAKEYLDKYLPIATDEDLTPQDYVLKGQIYAAVSGDDNVAIQNFQAALDMDTVYATKYNLLVDILSAYKKAGNKKCIEAGLGMMFYKLKRTPTHSDLFNPGLAYYQCGNTVRADSIFKAYIALYPDSIYGYFWDARLVSTTIDTAMEQGLAVPLFEKTLTIAETDKVKFKAQGLQSALYLAGYSNNMKKDKDAAIAYAKRGLAFDTANVTLKNILDVLTKPAKTPARGTGNPGTKPTGSVKPSATNTKSLAITPKTKMVAKS